MVNCEAITDLEVMRLKRTFAEKTFNVFNITFMLLIAVIMIYPYLNQMAISFNEGADSGNVHRINDQF